MIVVKNEKFLEVIWFEKSVLAGSVRSVQERCVPTCDSGLDQSRLDKRLWCGNVATMSIDIGIFEIQIYLAKFMPDPRRAEPRNVGVFVRTANDEVVSRFLVGGKEIEPLPGQMNFKEYTETVNKWRGSVEKYGLKALQWIGKRKSANQKLYIEFMGGEMVENFNIDKLFKELVL